MSETLRISEEEREALVTGDSAEFPKYTTQFINPANDNAQSTRPKNIGSMSQIIQEFREQHPDGSYEDWVNFYKSEYNGDERIEEATQNTYDMVEKMRDAIEDIDKEMVNRWIEDLVLYKTYLGFDTQEAIFRKLSKEYDRNYRRASPEDESKGIDGYLDDQPVSVKPETYKQQTQLQEDIQAPIVYYDDFKTSNALALDVTELVDHL